MPVGTTLLAGRYRTISRVGSGGMATVLLAEDERLGRQVAVKRLHAESPEDTARRFRREARLGASLNHPNLVAVYDIATDDEGVLIVMEYVDGETLRDAIDRGPVPPARALEVLRGVAAALDHAHEEGIVHRDVKPANVLLGRDGRTVKLADLGIATAVEGTRITMSGTVLGTAAYMAPEQLEGHKPGPGADVYSLAVVAWEALSGRRAYSGRTPLEIATRKASEAPPSLAEAWPDAPPAAVDALARAMGPDLAARPASATAFVDELERALEAPAPVPAPVRREASASVPASREVPAPVPAWREVPAPGRQEAAVPGRPQAQARPQAPVPLPDRSRNGRPRMTVTAARSRRGWLPALIALVAAVAVVAGLLLASGGGGSSMSGKSAAAASSKKKDRKPKKSKQPAAAAPQAPATSQPAAPAPAGAPSTGGYQLPQPAGTSAAQAFQLNQQGKSLSDSGNNAAAIPVLEKAVRAFPPGTTAAGDLNYAFTLFNLGHALRAGGRPADAVPVLEERLKNPDQKDRVQAELDAARQAANQG